MQRGPTVSPWEMTGEAASVKCGYSRIRTLYVMLCGFLEKAQHRRVVTAERSALI